MTKDIVLISDDNYCLPTLVCIQSIIDNIKNFPDKIVIHICTFGLSEQNSKRIKFISSDKATVCIDVFNKSQYEVCMSNVLQKTHVTPTALIKFELPNYFRELDSVLYLDSDIIIKKDISELLKQSLCNCYVAASYEFWKTINEKMYSFSKKSDSTFYFNSGVMLLNLKKMRADNISENLWYYKLHMSKTKLMDQESLNAVCGKKVLPLSINWNFNPIFLNKLHIKEINRVYGTKYVDIIDLEADVNIIHYVGKFDKPWVYKNARMRFYWDKYYKNLEQPDLLRLKDAEPTNWLSSIRDKVNNHGLLGLFSYILYRTKFKIRNLC